MRFYLCFTLFLLSAAPVAISAPSRIVSVGGANTELVCALGACDKLVAVDTSSVYPETLKPLQTIRYSRSLSTEAILAQKPDMIIVDEDAGPPHVIEKLESMKIPMLKVTGGTTVDDAKKRMKDIAAALGEAKKGEKLLADFDASLERLTKFQKDANKKRVMFIYARGGKHLMVVGGNTATATLIKLMGGTNAIQGLEGFKPLTAEAVAAARPDIILMTKSGAESLGGTDAIFNLPGMKITPAAAKKNLLLDDDLRLLTIGPRTADVIESMHARLDANKG
jgi:iron complex transport system substrate-binding protein